MATTNSAQLERETEQTRAQLEHTLDELRMRASPGQLLDQASDYLRNSSGRAFFGNLRDQVVDNPLPIALIGAGIAWLAVSGAVARRGNGQHRQRGDGRAADWGNTAATVDDLAHGGRDAGDHPRRGAAAELGDRAHDTAEGWAERVRDSAGGTRATAEGWIDETRDTLSHAGGTVRGTAEDMQRRTSKLYDRTVDRARRAASGASDYAGTAQDRIAGGSDALMNFCREQPMLVAGIGVALGAALGAMLPGTRTERQVMGEASRDVQEKVGDLATERYEHAKKVGGELYEEAKERAAEELDSGLKQAAGQEHAAHRFDSGREPQSAAPYAEAAEAGSAPEEDRARPAFVDSFGGRSSEAAPGDQGAERS